MIILACTIIIVVNINNVHYAGVSLIEGNLISETRFHYYVDFNKGLSEGETLYGTEGTKMSVNKKDCIKGNQ